MVHRHTRTALAAALIVLPGAAAGCTTAAAPPPDPAGAVAIVVQSNAASLRPELGDRLVERLRLRAEDPDSDDAVAHVVADRDHVGTVDLEPRRPNGRIERGAERIHTLVAERLSVLRAEIGRAEAEGGVDDPLTALATAGRTGAGTIIVLSAGVTATDPLDQRVLGWDRDPAALAADLRDRGMLPDLSGREVVLGGLGRTTGDQPALGVREQTALRERWTAICAATGAAHCLVDDAVRSREPSSSRVRTPPVPALPVLTDPGPAAVWEVPAPLLFRPGGCELLDRDAAGRVLAPLVDRLRHDDVRVSISGRTAPVGHRDGTVLAQCRATRTAELLVSRGVPREAIAGVHGDGSALDPPESSLGPDGRPDPAKLAALRRVVFTIEQEDPS